MRHAFAVLCLASALALLTGCPERDDTFTLNPDGSGKCAIDVHLDALNPKRVPAQSDVEMLKQMLQSAHGVEAWSDVSYVVEPDGRPHFKGTAYFKDLSAFRFTYAGIGAAQWAKAPDGGMTLNVSTGITGNRNAKSAAASAAFTEDQVQKAMRQMRQSVAAQKDSFQKYYAGLSIRLTFLLPGKVRAANILKNVPGGVELRIDDKKLADGMDKFVHDDAALRAACIRNGLNALQLDDTLMRQVLFGQTGPMQAAVAGDLQPLFDYRAQSTAARGKEPAMFAKLGLPAETTTAPPPLDQPLMPHPTH